jgi:hypothetical protein
MYTRISRSGGRAYLQLVEGYRTDDGKVRQRLICNLMRVDQLKPGALDPLIRGLQRVAGQTESKSVSIASAASAEFAPARAFGHLFALHQIWNQLGLSTALRQCFAGSRRQFDAEALIRAMVFNRLVDPKSKLGLLEWLGTVSMPECPMPTHQQLLRAMDALIDQIEPIEAAVCQQIRPLLDQSASIIFYDLTTLRYCGAGLPEDDMPLIAHGLSKSGLIEKQMVLGVVQSAEGIPLFHTVAPGNIGEGTTLIPMLQHALKRFPIRQMIVVADRGLLSLESIQTLEAMSQQGETQIDFILAVPARRYKELRGVVDSLVFEDGLAESTFANHRLVVAHDPERAAAQTQARREKLSAVEALAERLARKLDAQDEGERAAGRKATDRGAYARFSRELKDHRLTKLIRINWKAELFTYERNETAIRDAEQLDGKLFLLTSLKPAAFDTKTIVTRYKALADIERGFRTLKSELLIAPMHHRLERRLRAHALICFLALLTHRVLRSRLKQANAAHSPASALRALEQIQRHEVRIDAQTFQGVTRQDQATQQLCEQLSIAFPS